jgi:hypothetical protein
MQVSHNGNDLWSTLPGMSDLQIEQAGKMEGGVRHKSQFLSGFASSLFTG